MAKMILIAAGIAFLWFLIRRGQAEHLDREVIEAARLLCVSPRAGIEEINAAHRKQIAQTHPDKGGSEELTQRLNAARDTMIKARRS